MLVSLVIVPSAILLIVMLERRWAASPVPAERLRNFGAYGLYLLAQFLLLPMVDARFLVPSLVDLGQWPFLWGALAFILLMDFAEFAFHRMQHMIPFMWRMHALHHSDPNMNASTAVRHFWGDQLLKAVSVWPLCWLILKPTPMIILAYLVVSFYHFFVHANLRVDFGRYSWLINGPAYHRRHHSIEPRHFNCNYAALFPIFDVLFGSYRRPDGYPSTGQPVQPRGLSDIALWPLRGGSQA